MPRTLATVAETMAKAALAPENRIKTWCNNLTKAGFNDKLFTDRKPWDVAESESEEDPYEEQLLAALQVFGWMFVGAERRAWVHLAAEMQAGKSGVINALIRLVLQNFGRLAIGPKRIFVLTGMSDDAWRKQTRLRVPRDVRDNVHHSGGLKKVAESLRTLAAKDGLRNILIVLDESQVASSAGNRPNKLVYDTIRELVPMDQWVERNIRFLTVSATDPAKVMSMESCNVPCRPVRLLTSKAYQSVETLWTEGRIRPLEMHDNIGSSKTSIKELHRAVDSYDTPLWHILRPQMRKTSDVEAKLRAEFPRARVISWDSNTRASGAGEEDSESSASMDDINSLLASPPEEHSFIVLKNMLYAAKTLNDKYVGVLWDRMGAVVGGDNARLQSLLGRACGYGKSKRTIVYTSKETVERYLGFWRELCHSIAALQETTEHKASALHRRMPGVSAVETETGAKVVLTKSIANPAGTNQKAVPKSQKKKDVGWSPEVFETVAEAKSWADAHLSKGASAMYPCDKEGKKTGALLYFKYRGGLRRILSHSATLASGDLDWGQGGSAEAKTGSPRILPVDVNGKTQFLVVFKKFYQKA